MLWPLLYRLLLYEARTQIWGALEELLALSNFLDALRGRSIARLLYLCFFFSAWPRPGWLVVEKPQNGSFSCPWTRILTRRESRNWVKIEESTYILITRSGVYLQPHYKMILCEANSYTHFWDCETLGNAWVRVLGVAVLVLTLGYFCRCPNQYS